MDFKYDSTRIIMFGEIIAVHYHTQIFWEYNFLCNEFYGEVFINLYWEKSKHYNLFSGQPRIVIIEIVITHNVLTIIMIFIYIHSVLLAHTHTHTHKNKPIDAIPYQYKCYR